MTCPRFTSRSRVLTGLALVGCSISLAAQDSVSKVTGIPGDALDATDVFEQRNDYVVDLTSFLSSWGEVYGVAPIAKSSRSNDPAISGFFNNRMSAAAISKDLLLGAPFAATSYAHWTAPGFGVNGDPTFNDAGLPVDTTGAVGAQFAFAFSDFVNEAIFRATADGGSAGAPGLSIENNIVGGIVHYLDSTPSRLHVARITAATNSSTGTCSDVEFGLGSVDADGNVHLRGDDFGLFAPCGTPAVGNNLYRVDMAARSAAIVNHVSGLVSSGDPAATTRLLSASFDVHIAPAGALFPVAMPVLMTSNFIVELVREAVAGTTTASSAHLAPGVTEARGAVALTASNFAMFPGSTQGTGGILAKDAMGLTRSINVWGVAPLAAPVLPRELPLPGTLTDNDDGFAVASASTEFTHYFGAIAFRGGTSQVALASDVSGNLLAAATANHPDSNFGPSSELNLVAVARTDGAGTATSWTIAGYTTATGGKEIFDSTGVNPIGTLVPSTQVPPSFFGCSISSPAFDAQGNLYFLATYQLDSGKKKKTFAAGGTAGAGGASGAIDAGVGLFRARYDPLGFAYKLELMLRVGDVFHGHNSDLDYQIRRLSLSGGVGSLLSASMFSSSVSDYAHRGVAPASLPDGDPRALGGLIVSASIVYDVNSDGFFDRAPGLGGIPGTPDEEYSVLLHVQPAEDCDLNGIPDDIQIADDPLADLDGNGVPDVCDPPANDDCSNAIALPGSFAVTAFDATNATTDGPDAAGSCDYGDFGDEQNHNDVWFTYTPDVGGCTYISTLGLVSWDSRLSVYLGSDCPPSNADLLACVDDEVLPIAGPFEAGLDLDLVAGATYTIRLGTFGPGTPPGAGSIRIAEGPGAAANSGGANPGAPGCSILRFCAGDGGDQAGCTDCPCTNNAPVGSRGGCLNTSGTSAELLGSGSPSVAGDSLRFEVEAASPSSFGLLFSADNRLPNSMGNPCFGQGSGVISPGVLDGLRCMGGNLVRHGTRASNASGDIGVTGPGWGPPNGPPGGLIAQGAASVPASFAVGSTRHFQCFYRVEVLQGCMTGLNTTNGQSVTILP